MTSRNFIPPDQLNDYGVTLLRIALGTMFVAHGLLKFLVFGLDGTAGYFASIGLPGFLAYFIAPAEVAAGIALLVGFQTRWVSLASLPILLGATWAHSGNGWVFSGPNGGWEYPLYLSLLATAQAMLGSGAMALDRKYTQGYWGKLQTT